MSTQLCFDRINFIRAVFLNRDAIEHEPVLGSDLFAGYRRGRCLWDDDPSIKLRRKPTKTAGLEKAARCG
ncbi:MAG: hypothetical protein ACE5OP_06735 [Candidatus Glassbacteria bacterium]